jgi:hypothetical protein
MLILHAAWLNEKLHLWGEKTPEGGPGEPRGPRRRKNRAAQAPLLPYDAGDDGLKAALGAFPSGLRPDRRNMVPADAWLPTSGWRPVSSSPMIAEPPEETRDLTLVPWRVSALALDEAQGIDFLCACMGRQPLARGVAAGADLSWWSEALRLAAALVVRQSYLPGVAGRGNTLVARWQPVFEGEERGRVEALARRMPSSARCLAAAGHPEPPQGNPQALLRRFIEVSLDRMVRGAVVEAAGSRGRRLRRAGPRAESIHEAWALALQQTSPVIRWKNRRQIAELQDEIAKWRRPVDVAAGSACRLCFRVEEPPEEGSTDGVRVSDGHWAVRYLLQPLADRSLLVPVREVWNGRSRRAAMLHKIAGDTREYLFSAFGLAAGICPPVAASLEAKDPAGCEVDLAGAHAFLTRFAPALETAGFGVILPKWWTRGGARQRIAVRAAVQSPMMQANAGIGLETLARVNWRLALGDEPLSLRELRQLAECKLPLVQLRGQWVELDAEQIREVAEALRGGASTDMTAGDVVRMALGIKSGIKGLPLSGIDAEGAIGDLLDRLRNPGRYEELTVPSGFAGTLRPYQVRGYSWFWFLKRWGLGACLADDMGLGKTVQSLAFFARMREAGERRPALLICPTSVVTNWAREASRFTPGLPVMIHHGLRRAKGKRFIQQASSHALVVSSYGLLHRDLDFLQSVDWCAMVLDEAQNIKNPATKQSRAARALSAGFRVALTGTPVENHVGDLWAIMDFLNPGFLGSQASFNDGFFKPIQVYGDGAAAERLRRVTGPFILRRLKTDTSVIADLPEKMEMKTYCTLTREQASLYAAVVKEIEEDLEAAEGMRRRGLILSALTRLKQICNHPAQFLSDNSAIPGRSGKLIRLVEMLEETSSAGDRALVFSQFAEMGALLKTHLQDVFGREVFFLHGGVGRTLRDRMVTRFQDDAQAPAVFVLSLKAGGTGLNLTRASRVFHFDRWWNPSVENQATDRAYRIGQTKNVHVHKFVCAGTLEERIDALIERKTAVAASVVGAGENWLTELSNEDLKQIFALGAEAVAD